MTDMNRKTLVSVTICLAALLAVCLAAEAKPPKKEEPKGEVSEAASMETPGEANARASAEDYLDFSAFSKQGLIKQLKFEGYSQAEAEYAVNAVEADWFAEAEEAAEDYLDFSSFSRQGLVKQLKFDGFTQEQAEHGAESQGL